ncbi:site-specific integrase [Novosphingobium sp. KN65.2]|uniref:tyrosine-type recombinase/integrase n=1 Tax=Novosphingobium sp. KN65.2 TaxID=1478134 RepID=UPI0005DB305A|nr:site-specific integrase [Novosphingobium sp. KN65.2]CDO36027.1 Integrase family protein [Novosphingobium sp. KN65.2]
MAKTLKEAPLTTRNARDKLPEGLHWRGIDPEVHLGYRKGKRGGVWLVRWRNGVGYRQERLGTADDQIAEDTLSYADAVKGGREKVEAARREARANAEGPAETVRSAVAAYISMRDARDSERAGRTVRSTASYRLELHLLGREANGRRKAILPASLADTPLHDLAESKLMAWRQGLPVAMKATTQKRLINDLKAALNAACTIHRQKLPHTLPNTIKHGLTAPVTAPENSVEVARENQILPDGAIGRIISAAKEVDGAKGWGGDLYRMIVVLAATGARFSQVARLRVSDVQAEKSRILVPTSRKGRGNKNGSTPVPIGQDVLAALVPAIERRDPGDALLLRWNYEQSDTSIRWTKTSRSPWRAAYEILPFWAAIRKAASLDASVVPYALRHSSIVRGIRAGLPLRLVAALHDTSVEMIERHYGRWIADGLDDLAARAVVPLVPSA